MHTLEIHIIKGNSSAKLPSSFPPNLQNKLKYSTSTHLPRSKIINSYESIFCPRAVARKTRWLAKMIHIYPTCNYDFIFLYCLIEIGINVMHNFNAYFSNFFFLVTKVSLVSRMYISLIKGIIFWSWARSSVLRLRSKQKASNMCIKILKDQVVLFSNVSKIYDCFIFCYLCRFLHSSNSLNCLWESVII